MTFKKGDLVTPKQSYMGISIGCVYVVHKIDENFFYGYHLPNGIEIYEQMGLWRLCNDQEKQCWNGCKPMTIYIKNNDGQLI